MLQDDGWTMIRFNLIGSWSERPITRQFERGTLMDDYSGIFDLTGRRALVIGGASGIGRASCFGLASFGAQVFCADIAIDQAKATAQAIVATGRGAEAL